MIFAHSLENRPESSWETLESHSLRVAQAAAARAETFGGGEYARFLGLLHDLGKEKPAFQRKLNGERNTVSHSGEGARVLHKTGDFTATLAGIIAGHHGHLPDPDRLKSRVDAAEDIVLPGWCPAQAFELPERLGECPKLTSYRLQFLVRMLYGALCDADDRETAAFYAEAEGRSIPKHPTSLTPGMRDAFEAHMARIGGDGMVNDLRRQVCQSQSKMGPCRGVKMGHFG